jgi:hypothetical protein
MKFLLVAALLLLQPGPRAPLAPAETLLAPELLRAIVGQAPLPDAGAAVAGTDASAHVLVTCVEGQCGSAARAVRKLSALVSARAIEQPLRSIRVSSTFIAANAARATAVIHVAEATDRAPRIIRGLWSTAGIGDEAAEVFARHLVPGIEVGPYEKLGQLPFDSYGIPTTTIVANPAMSSDAAASVVALTAYFLATLPNAGSEALLSHLTVGAHARLAEDGRKAVAMMGNQQRASAEVLIMFGQAIDREQRRMRSFERFMPSPVDPMLHSRIVDMEKGISSVWTSMGITSSPFVPPAERIRGRGGEDRRVPSKVKPGAIAAVEPPTAFLKFENTDTILYELANFIDGTRSISDIRDAVSAEFGALPVPSVTDYFDRLAKNGGITIK